jgi:hypothetical protein
MLDKNEPAAGRGHVARGGGSDKAGVPGTSGGRF